MTPEIIAWAREAIERHDIDRRGWTVEFGSLSVNGSLRQFFAGPYHGIDQVSGPGVDRVMRVAEIGKEWWDTADTVVCTEMLEHDLTFWVTLDRAYEILHADGYLLLTTCGYGAAVHDYPSDYYRFTTNALHDLLKRAGFKNVEVGELLRGNQAEWHTITAVGRK